MDAAEYRQIADYLRLAERSKYTYGDIQARFQTEQAATYGDNMGHWIPDFEYAHQLLLDSIAIHLPGSADMVELGAGTGRVSQLLLDTFPDVRLSLVDLSTNMLSAARQRLAAHAARCKFIVHDIFDPGLDFAADSADCVVSVFAICHAQGYANYQQLYQRIYRWLKPGG